MVCARCDGGGGGCSCDDAAAMQDGGMDDGINDRCGGGIEHDGDDAMVQC